MVLKDLSRDGSDLEIRQEFYKYLEKYLYSIINQTHYLAYDEARKFIHTLKFNNIEQWTDYKNGQLNGYEPKPENIPDRPQDIYENRGWVDFKDWIGVEK